MSFEILLKYFPEITSKQKNQFAQLENLYKTWNEQINVISRKDLDSLYEKHVLHSLGIAKILNFSPHTKVLDIGTGGGFPGIPLAILFPEVRFMLIDSIGKKIKVVEAVKNELSLENVKTRHSRAENIKDKYHFIVSRAVTQMPTFLSWLDDKFETEQFNAKPNGVLYLKGGDLSEELKGLKYELFDLKNIFEEEFFETKKVVYLNSKEI